MAEPEPEPQLLSGYREYPPLPLPDERVIPDGLILERDLAGGHWAVLRPQLTRRESSALDERMWAAGIFRTTLLKDFTADQWHVWEADWCERITLYVKAWSLRGDDGAVLPITLDGVDALPNLVFVDLKSRIQQIKPKTPEEAKSGGAGAQRLEQRSTSPNGVAAAHVS